MAFTAHQHKKAISRRLGNRGISVRATEVILRYSKSCFISVVRIVVLKRRYLLETNLPSQFIFSCIPDKDIRVFYLDRQFLSHPGPDKITCI